MTMSKKVVGTILVLALLAIAGCSSNPPEGVIQTAAIKSMYVMDDDQSLPSFRTAPENDDKSTHDIHSPEDDNSEPNDVTRICYRCQFCIQSGELSEGSDPYVCSRDGETLSSKRESRCQCFNFSERSDDSDEGYFQ